MRATRLIKWGVYLAFLVLFVLLATPFLLVARHVVPHAFGEFVEDFVEQLGRNCAIDLRRGV